MLLRKNSILYRSAFLFHEDYIESLRAFSRCYDEMSLVTYEPSLLGFSSMVERNTVVIDLTKAESLIFSELNDTTRYEIKKALNDKVFSLQKIYYGQELFMTGYKIYCTHERSQKRVPKKIKEFAGHYMFIGFMSLCPCAVVTVLPSDHVVKVNTISSLRLESQDKEFRKKVATLSRMLLWEAIRDSKELGFSTFDLAYVNLIDAGKRGIDSFKIAFGGNLIKDYTYVLRNTKSRFLLFFYKIFSRVTRYL